MTRLRRWSALWFLLCVAGLLSAVHGQDRPAGEKKPSDNDKEKWLLDRALTLTPAAAPVPSLKYRLYPLSSERKEGNAVPIYARLAHERNDGVKKQLSDNTDKWNKLPLDKLPLEEVKIFLDGYKYNLRQMDLAARRKKAEWNYTLDDGDPISIRLPDAQEMRLQARLLVLKARWEMAERPYANAVRTLETGFSFSQQIGEAPFLISGLVGIACASMFADNLLDLVERPDAPNLYWALAVIPRPLIDLRKANEFEATFLERQIPDLADLDRPRAAAEWDAALRRVREEIARIRKLSSDDTPPQPGAAASDPASKSPDLPAAHKYLAEVSHVPAARLDAMPPAEVLMRHMANYFHELRDELFQSTYLPFPRSRELAKKAEARLKAASRTEAGGLANFFLPAITKVRLAQVRIERKLAALRAIEALRMHAAAHDGKWPDKLEEVTIVPVPLDPGTGRPFEYKREGRNATLLSRIPGENLRATGLRYRLTMGK